jgi:hypothetical protein
MYIRRYPHDFVLARMLPLLVTDPETTSNLIYIINHVCGAQSQYLQSERRHLRCFRYHTDCIWPSYHWIHCWPTILLNILQLSSYW